MEFYHNLWLLLWLYSLQNSSVQLFKLIQTKQAKSAAGKLYPSWSPAQKWGGGKEHQTLSKSCLPGLWVSVLLPLRLLWCWAVLQGDATEWLPWQMAMNWQLKRALCREKKKKTQRNVLWLTDEISVTEIGSGFSRQRVCVEKLPEDCSWATHCVWAVGGLVGEMRGRDTLHLVNGCSKCLLGRFVAFACPMCCHKLILYSFSS